MSDLPELLPCPFCGSKGELGIIPANINSPDVGWVSCTECDCCVSWNRDDESPARAIAAWNRRADLAPVIGYSREQVEALKIAKNPTSSAMLDEYIKGYNHAIYDILDEEPATQTQEDKVREAVKLLYGDGADLSHADVTNLILPRIDADFNGFNQPRDPAKLVSVAQAILDRWNSPKWDRDPAVLVEALERIADTNTMPAFTAIAALAEWRGES